MDLEPAIGQLKENGLKIAANNNLSTRETFMSWKESNGGPPQRTKGLENLSHEERQGQLHCSAWKSELRGI